MVVLSNIQVFARSGSSSPLKVFLTGSPVQTDIDDGERLLKNWHVWTTKPTKQIVNPKMALTRCRSQSHFGSRNLDHNVFVRPGSLLRMPSLGRGVCWKEANMPMLVRRVGMGPTAEEGRSCKITRQARHGDKCYPQDCLSIVLLLSLKPQHLLYVCVCA